MATRKMQQADDGGYKTRAADRVFMVILRIPEYEHNSFSFPIDILSGDEVYLSPTSHGGDAFYVRLENSKLYFRAVAGNYIVVGVWASD